MIRWLCLLWLSFFLGLTVAFAEDPSLRIVTRHVTATGDDYLIAEATKTFIFDNLSGSTFQSLAYSTTATAAIDATYSVEVGYKVPGSSTIVYYPVTDLTDVAVSGASPQAAVAALTLPVAPIIRIIIANLSTTAGLTLTHLFLVSS